MTYSIDSKLSDLLDNPATQAVLEKHLPGISTHPQVSMGRSFPLKIVAQFSGGLITSDALEKIGADLQAV